MKMLDVPQSGSLAAQTSSRNRYGQYRRTRAIPVNPKSIKQQAVRARMQTNAAAWRALTALQRSGWDSLGASMTRTDSLGQTYTLTGFQAYASVNNNNLAAGNAVVSAAPALLTPDQITFGAVTLTAIAGTIAFTPTPLGAGERAFLYVSKQRSAGRAYEGDLRLLSASAAALATPINFFSDYTARFGTPVLGNRVFFSLVRYSGGFVSVSQVTSAVVSA